MPEKQDISLKRPKADVDRIVSDFTLGQEISYHASPFVEVKAWVNLQTLFQQEHSIRAANTWKQWQVTLQQFAAFAINMGYEKILPADPDAIKAWISSMQHQSFSTVAARISSLAALHDRAGIKGEDNPVRHETVYRRMEALKRDATTRMVQDQVLPIRISGTDSRGNCVMFHKLIQACPSTLIGKRDAMLLKMAMFTGVRRQELVSIQPGHIQTLDSGAGVLNVVRGKTDQEGKGHLRHLPAHFMADYTNWMVSVADQLKKHNLPALDLPIFPTFAPKGQMQPKSIKEHQIPRLFKSLCLKAGYDKVIAHQVAGHSPRIGLAQELVLQGNSLTEIKVAMGWKSESSVFKYVRHLLTESNAVASTLSTLFVDDVAHSP